MATIEQHRRLAIGCSQLKTPGGSLIGLSDLRDNACERTIAQGILRHSKHGAILLTLSIEDLIRAKPYLLQSRRIEVEARECPEHGKTGLVSETSCYARRKKCRRSVVTQCGGRRRDLMKTAPGQPMIGKAFVQRTDAKCKRWSTRRAGIRQLCANSSKVIGTRPIREGRQVRHGNMTTQMFPLCSNCSADSSSAMINALAQRPLATANPLRFGASWHPECQQTSDRARR